MSMTMKRMTATSPTVPLWPLSPWSCVGTVGAVGVDGGRDSWDGRGGEPLERARGVERTFHIIALKLKSFISLSMSISRFLCYNISYVIKLN